MADFARDPAHWLLKHTPREWIRASLKELRVAEAAYGGRNARAGLAGCRRAAGMALNGALIVQPRDSWKRSYVEHIEGVANDEAVPLAVREAARLLLDVTPPGGSLVLLRSRASDEKVLEAARDVMAHAYAVVIKHEPKSD